MPGPLTWILSEREGIILRALTKAEKPLTIPELIVAGELDFAYGHVYYSLLQLLTANLVVKTVKEIRLDGKLIMPRVEWSPTPEAHALYVT